MNNTKKILFALALLASVVGCTPIDSGGSNFNVSIQPPAQVQELKKAAPKIEEVQKIAPWENTIKPKSPTIKVESTTQLSNDNYYKNTDGNQVHSPAYSNTIPAGATAQCRDGTYSFSQNRRGTCSHHGGVDTWL